MSRASAASSREVVPSQPEPKRAKRKPGRPKGSIHGKVAAARAGELVATRRSPLDVMLRNMWFWDEAAQNMEQRLMTQMQDMEEQGIDEEKIEAMKELLKNNLIARDKAQECAVDAAPYVHAKFQSVVFKDETNKVEDKKEIFLELPKPAGDSNDDRSYREGWSSNVVPMQAAE